MVDIAPNGGTAQKAKMSLLVHFILAQDIIGDDQYDPIIAVSQNDGYTALYNIMHQHHPRLMDRTVPRVAPFQKRGKSFGNYILHYQTFINHEEARGRVYMHGELLDMMVANLRVIYCRGFPVHLAQTKFELNEDGSLPYNLELQNWQLRSPSGHPSLD